MDCFEALQVSETAMTSPTSKTSKGAKKYGLGKSTSKSKDRKSKDRLSVNLNVIIQLHFTSFHFMNNVCAMCLVW